MPASLPVRLRARLSRGVPPRADLVARHVAGRSFADVGCMWSVHGAISFAAEDAGATEVSGMDVMGQTAEFQAEHARRGSKMRFVQGDLHDEVALAGLGAHDVVWCSGVLYHAPHPLLTLERLRSVTRETLILATETIPERIGRRNVCVFAPEPGIHPTHTEPFDPARGYVNWYWAITPSALRAMLGAGGFEITEEHRTAYHTTVVAQVTRPG
ncbi:class I SAM-dependent methyltransferase [Paraconexibacter sp.]|uniref:class I SAM-dependent methyltransferase n=1 Tax=Paraconexibacter sp. TaxID=2949640 RepID=UPI003565BF03